MDEELEGLELDVLRRQALKTITPKKRGNSRRHHHSTKELESEFGIDELLSTNKFHSSPRKARRLHKRRGRSTPELSREVIETFSSRPRKPRHNFSPRPERRYSDRHTEPPDYMERGRPVHKKVHVPKQQSRRRSLASSSRSSYSSSSGSRSHSHSSYTSSRSSSRSSSTSTSHSYSRSHSSTSASYSRSSYSSSSQSRSVTPEHHPPKKVEKHGKKQRTLPHSYQDGNHEERKYKKDSKRVSSPAPPTSERHKKLKASVERDWYPEHSPYERRGPYETPHGAHMRSPPPVMRKMRPPPPVVHKMKPSPEVHKTRPLPPGLSYRNQDHDQRLSKRRLPHSPSDYHEGDDYYHSSDRRTDYPPGRPRGPRPPSPGEGRVVRRIARGRFPPDRPRPPPREHYRDGLGPYRRGPPPLSPPPPPGRRGGYIPHSRGGRGVTPERGRMSRSFAPGRERVRRSPPERGRMDREFTPESERVRRSLPRSRMSRDRTPERERERERVKRSSPGQLIRRPAWEEDHSRIHRHPERERVHHHLDQENEQRSPIKSTGKTLHKSSKHAASVSTNEELSEVKKLKHSSEEDLKKKSSKTQKREEKPAEVSESSLGDPVPEVPQEDSSDSNTVSYIPMHEDISPQKEEVKATDDEEVDEISDLVDSSCLMGTLEEEELDYDENMDDLDLHPTGTLDDGDGLTIHIEETTPKGKEERSLHRKRKKSRREDSSSENESEVSESESEPQRKRHKGTHNESMSGSDHEGGGTPIRSPIRVSPDHKEPRLVRETHSRPDSSKLSVKERLYVSKKTIEEKKRMIQYQDEPPSSLRPSLANRLGPSPYGGSRRRTFIDLPRHGSRGMGRRPIGHSKGDAFAIAEAYKRKKRQEMLRDEDVTKAKNITKIINEPDSKPVTKKIKEEEGEKERALDKRIDEIKEQNKAIMKRKSEVEMDKELYG